MPCLQIEESLPSCVVCFGDDEFTQSDLEIIRRKIRKHVLKMQSATSQCDEEKQDNQPADLGVNTDTRSVLDHCENYVALDCEFVGVGPRKLSALGRCSIVDYSGEVLCDLYVRPKERITDYRTKWSGLRKNDFTKAISFTVAQRKIQNIINGKIVIGHALHNDLNVLEIQHAAVDIRDTSKYRKLLSQLPPGKGPSLKNLSFFICGKVIQEGEHCSVEDSRAALDLYKSVSAEWEADVESGIYPRKVKAERKKSALSNNSNPSERKFRGKRKRSIHSAESKQSKRRRIEKDRSQCGIAMDENNSLSNGIQAKDIAQKKEQYAVKRRTRTFSRNYMGDEFWPSDLSN